MGRESRNITTITAFRRAAWGRLKPVGPLGPLEAKYITVKTFTRNTIKEILDTSVGPLIASRVASQATFIGT